ncbi:MAG TPA: A24 family peptidase [Candidatus Nanoarchaeia archaeon]|nr:A24 family peptidase [Candidatus Nanoarchaeia archaeon]
MQELFILTIITLVWLFFASITDIKKREIPDWLSYSLIILALTTHIISSVKTQSFFPILSSILSAILFSALAFLLYYTRQWGGGDVKLFIALGFSFPVYPDSLLAWFNPGINLYFPLIIILNLILSAALYSLLALLILIIKNKANFLKELRHYPLTKLKIIAAILALILFALSFTFQTKEAVYAIILAILLILFPYLLASTKAIEKLHMIKTIPIAKAEGEWLSADVYIKDKLILSKTIPEITQHHINILKKHNIKTIKIKTGIPFVPAFFIALLLSLLFGNLLSFLF